MSNNEKRQGTPRARVTEIDQFILSFLSMFPASTAETLANLQLRKATFRHQKPQNNSPVTIENRLRKLKKLGCVEDFRTATGDKIYGATPLGFGSSQGDLGLKADYTTLNGLSLKRLNHYKHIAQVASQFINPIAPFRDTIGANPVGLQDLFSEKYMIRNRKALIDQNKGTEWGIIRNQKLNEIYPKEKEKRLIESLRDIWDLFPAMLTIGFPTAKNDPKKGLLQPDLAVYSRRNDGSDFRLACEIELSQKTYDDYFSVVKTWQEELKTTSFAYDAVVYFTHKKSIENLLIKADRNSGARLIEQKKLFILPFTNADGEPIEADKTRVSLPPLTSLND